MIDVRFEQDSYEMLKRMPSQSVDVMITDPPFSAHCQANMCSGSLVGTKSVPKYALEFAPMTDYAWLLDAVRVTRRWVVVFCAVEDFGRFETAVGRPTYVRGCVWIKPNAMGQLTRDRPATAYEGIALFHGDGEKKRWNGRGSYGVWKCNGTRGKKGRHANEKPLDLCLKLVSLFSERGETVLDPFCGSGAIGEACVKLGRSYLGMDQSTEWVGKASDRLRACHDQVSDEVAALLCRMQETTTSIASNRINSIRRMLNNVPASSRTLNKETTMELESTPRNGHVAYSNGFSDALDNVRVASEGQIMSTLSTLEAYKQNQIALRQELDAALANATAIARALGLGTEVGILQGGVSAPEITPTGVQAAAKTGRRAKREQVGAGIGQDDAAKASTEYPVVTGRAAGQAAKTRALRAAKRTSSDVQAMLDQVVGLLNSKETGMRSEEIREALSCDKADLAPALKLGVSSGALTVTGVKRASSYSVAA